MENNIKLVEELKSGNSSRTTFFKNEVIKQLKKFDKDTNEETVDYYFNLAIDSYDESVKIPFVFHIGAVIKNSVNKSNIDKKEYLANLNSNEYKALKLYFSKQGDRYISIVEIADIMKTKPSIIKDIIDKHMENDENIKKVFKNYKQILEERQKYFDSRKHILSNEYITLICEFCGAFSPPMVIDDLALKHEARYIDIKNKITSAFRLLTIDSNLNMLLERYPNIEETLKEKAKKFNVEISYDKNKEKKLTSNKRKVVFNKDDIAILDLIYLEYTKQLTKEKIKASKYSSIIEYFDKKNRFIGKINNNDAFFTEIENLYPKLDIKEYLSQPRLTLQEITVLSVLCDENNKDLSEEETVEKAGIKSIRSLNNTKNRIYYKLNNSNYLKEIIMLIFENFDINLVAPPKEEDKDDKDTFTDEEIKMLKLLNDHYDLRNKDLAYLGEYKSDSSFSNKKYALFRKIAKSEILKSEVKSNYPDINMKKENHKTNLKDTNEQLLSLLNSHKNNPLSDEEMAAKLNLANTDSYITIKNRLFKELRNDETIKRWALTIYPELTVASKIDGSSINFASDEIFFLQEFCLVRKNTLVYQSTEEISNKLSISYDDATNLRTSVTDKVVKNMIVGNDLDLVVWNNFLDEFITRDSSDMKRSVLISDFELLMFKSNNNNDKSNIIMGINNLENSIYADYAKKCTDLEKLILALRLGFFNKVFFSSYDISVLLKTSEMQIISLTKDCLYNTRENYLNNKKSLRLTKS